MSGLPATRCDTSGLQGVTSTGGPAVAASLDEVLVLEGAAARAWPAPDTTWVDGWLLRAAGGFTGRANSAVPLSRDALDAASAAAGGTGLPPVLDAIVRWYAERGLPTLVAVPMPGLADLHHRLVCDGWGSRGPTLMLTAAVDAVLAACKSSAHLPQPRLADTPEDDWLGIYGRREALAPPGRDVVAGGGATFATLNLENQPAAIARWVVDGSWVGLSAVTVASAHRRRGLATHLAGAAMRDARERGATHAWLQVEGDNTAALALYRRLGFEVHHEYWYHSPPNDGADT